MRLLHLHQKVKAKERPKKEQKQELKQLLEVEEKRSDLLYMHMYCILFMLFHFSLYVFYVINKLYFTLNWGFIYFNVSVVLN